MKTFGDAGSFDYIIQRLSQPMDLELALAFIDLTSAPYNVYHRTFVKCFVQPFVGCMLRYLTGIPEDDMKNLKKDRLEDALLHLEHLMRRVFSVRQRTEETIRLRAGIGLRLLRSELLERRIEGIRLISETCRLVKFSQSSTSAGGQSHEIALLNKVLQVPQIIEQVFGRWSHIQLIQRSTEILNFLLMYNSLSKPELEVLWECCLRDEQSKVEVYKVINESLSCLSKETVIAFLVEKFVKMPPSQLRSVDLSLLFEFEHKFTRLPAEVLGQALDLMWNVSLRKEEYTGTSADAREQSLEKFCEVVSSMYYVPEALTLDYFCRMYRMVEDVCPVC